MWCPVEAGSNAFCVWPLFYLSRARAKLCDKNVKLHSQASSAWRRFVIVSSSFWKLALLRNEHSSTKIMIPFFFIFSPLLCFVPLDLEAFWFSLLLVELFIFMQCKAISKYGVTSSLQAMDLARKKFSVRA